MNFLHKTTGPNSLNAPLIFILLSVAILSVGGCSKKPSMTAPPTSDPTLAGYVPLKVGNSWTYSGFTVNTAGTGDTSIPTPMGISILQTNLLIAGEPNAFIVKTVDGRGNVTYLSFFMDQKTIWHYLGTQSTFPYNDNFILWASGGYAGAVIGVNQTKKIYIIDQPETSSSFSIMRLPEPTVASANMASQDTLEITGVSTGATMLTLKKTNGAAADTMTVLIDVNNSAASSLASTFPPWIPLWQLTTSSTDETVFTVDTTYKFKCIRDSAECSDELCYRITNRYMGDEIVPALNTNLQCDAFEMKVTLVETVTYMDKTQSQVLFAGPSSFFTIDTWLAKGIGFVKGRVNGNSLPPIAVMGGVPDSSGVLNGYYISPRVTYASINLAAVAQKEYFHVDDTPLAPSPIYKEFKLVQKSF